MSLRQITQPPRYLLLTSPPRYESLQQLLHQAVNKSSPWPLTQVTSPSSQAHPPSNQSQESIFGANQTENVHKQRTANQRLQKPAVGRGPALASIATMTPWLRYMRRQVDGTLFFVFVRPKITSPYSCLFFSSSAAKRKNDSMPKSIQWAKTGLYKPLP